ncbi:MAG: carotenoid biosynthesis protein [bacterium]|nr:carotenoid biosynthesis protein [bacterium]
MSNLISFTSEELYTVSSIGTVLLALLLTIEEYLHRQSKISGHTISGLLLVAMALATIPHVIAFATLQQVLINLPIFLLIPYFSEAAAMRWSNLVGKYRYRDRIGPVLPLGVPVGVVFAWLIILYCSFFTATIVATLLSFSPFHSMWFVPLFAALLCVLYDLIIDPINVAAGNWSWSEELQNPVWLNRKLGASWYNIPTGNFVGWFLIAFLTLSLTTLLGGLPVLSLEPEAKSMLVAFPLLWQSFVLVFRALEAQRFQFPHLAIASALYSLSMAVLFLWWLRS